MALVDMSTADASWAGYVAARGVPVVGGDSVTAPFIWDVAAMGATMHACFGPRLDLCLGRGEEVVVRLLGLRRARYRDMLEYARLYRRLWQGETVSHRGASGTLDGFSMSETYDGGEQPKLWFGTLGNPRGAEVAAEAFDGVVLPPMYTVEATQAAVRRIRDACRRIGRDPAEIRIVQSVVTAPGLSEEETRQLAHGRTVSYFVYPGFGEMLAQLNGWDEDVVLAVRNHPMFARSRRVPDMEFHRHEMLEPARLIPDEWMQESCAIGPPQDCARAVQRYLDAGADEVATYGSTPQQNAEMIEAFRRMRAAEAMGATYSGQGADR